MKDGKIVFANGMCVLDCTIRDRTESAARLVVPQTLGIPDTFYLLEKSNGTMHSAAIVWRQSNAVGVKLIGIVNLTDSDNPRLIRLKSLS